MELADIGKTFRRLDYETKVTGKAQYLADMQVPGMCHGKILRSPLPHARIKSIDTSKALKVPGVVAVITRDDILHDEGIEPYYGPVFKDQTIVAVEKVRHVGDPVAAVAALDVDAAEEALRSDRRRIRRAAGGFGCPPGIEARWDFGPRVGSHT